MRGHPATTLHKCLTGTARGGSDCLLRASYPVEQHYNIHLPPKLEHARATRDHFTYVFDGDSE
eukprot:758445-Pyramimonas_sp.AAC.1